MQLNLALRFRIANTLLISCTDITDMMSDAMLHWKLENRELHALKN